MASIIDDTDYIAKRMKEIKGDDSPIEQAPTENYMYGDACSMQPLSIGELMDALNEINEALQPVYVPPSTRAYRDRNGNYNLEPDPEVDYNLAPCWSADAGQILSNKPGTPRRSF